MSYQFTLEPEKLESELKKLIIRETEKDEVDPMDISDDEWLFGEQSRIQLDSLDALQVVVALQAHFGVRLQGDRMVRKHMMNVRDLAAFIRAQHAKA
ncbi:acyl carrier protein [Aggregatibacter actinomycetemcomitans]|nr:acyl carrier protein [Aggregatibacter actinomycetemcomitans]